MSLAELLRCANASAKLVPLGLYFTGMSKQLLRHRRHMSEKKGASHEVTLISSDHLPYCSSPPLASYTSEYEADPVAWSDHGKWSGRVSIGGRWLR